MVRTEQFLAAFPKNSFRNSRNSFCKNKNSFADCNNSFGNSKNSFDIVRTEQFWRRPLPQGPKTVLTISKTVLGGRGRKVLSLFQKLFLLFQKLFLLFGKLFVLFGNTECCNHDGNNNNKFDLGKISSVELSEENGLS